MVNQKKMLLTGLFLFVGISILAIVVCSGIGSNPDNHTSSPVKEVKDIAGNPVLIPKNVSRLVTIDPFTSQFIYIIGGTDQMVGTCVGPSDKKILKQHLTSLAEIPSAGCKGVNLETLVKMNPQVVISSILYNKTDESIQTTSIPLFLVEFENPKNLISSYRMIGTILGKEEKTEEFIAYYYQEMNLIKNDTARLNESEKKKVYVSQGTPLTTIGTGWYQNEMIQNTGGINVASNLTGGSNQISIEQLYTWNPDIIILFPYGTKTVDDILSDPAFSKLKAVQNHQVYRLPGYIMSWDMPVPESILASLWMGNIIHPGKVSYNLSEEIRIFYSRFYKIDLQQSEIDEILNYQSNLTNITKCGDM